MKRIIVILLGSMLSMLLLPSSGFATTNEVRRLSVSLVGYTELEPVMTTDSSETVNTFRQDVAKFKISTKDIVNEIGLLMAKSFSRKASLYMDEDHNLVIEDAGVKTMVPSEIASADLVWDAVASRVSASSIETDAKQTFGVGTKDYSTFTLDLKIGEATYHLKGFSKGSYKVQEDYINGTSSESWKEKAAVIGEANPGGEAVDMPVKGKLAVYEQSKVSP